MLPRQVARTFDCGLPDRPFIRWLMGAHPDAGPVLARLRKLQHESGAASLKDALGAQEQLEMLRQVPDWKELDDVLGPSDDIRQEVILNLARHCAPGLTAALAAEPQEPRCDHRQVAGDLVQVITIALASIAAKRSAPAPRRRTYPDPAQVAQAIERVCGGARDPNDLNLVIAVAGLYCELCNADDPESVLADLLAAVPPQGVAV